MLTTRLLHRVCALFVVCLQVYVIRSYSKDLLVYGNLTAPPPLSSSSSSSSTARGSDPFDNSHTGLSSGAVAIIVIIMLLLFLLCIPCAVSYCLYRYAGMKFPLLARLTGGRLFSGGAMADSSESYSSSESYGSSSSQQWGGTMGRGSAASAVPMLNSR